MEQLLEYLARCIERGKLNAAAPYPPDLRGAEGADETARRALDAGITPSDILSQSLLPAMQRVGERFRDKVIFVPDVLMAARAMSAAMNHLAPFFQSKELSYRGTFIIGTVRGDLHDIGKKLVSMVVGGSGWKVIDLGIDVPTESFLEAIDGHPEATVGLSALLTTTMMSMKQTVQEIKSTHPHARILVGGAPVTQAFASSIGADGYASDPQGAVEFLGASSTFA